MDPTRVLDVPADADKQTITKAYRKMALKYHPDKAGDQSKLKFQHIGAAYEILMARPGGKETGSGQDEYTGMSDEDVAWIKDVRSRQEKEFGSFEFSFESDSSFTDEAAGALKDCPICNGPCNVEEFVTAPLFDPSDFTSWPTSVSASFSSPPAQQKPKAHPPPPSCPCSPASENPKPAQTSSAQFPTAFLTEADNTTHFLLRLRDHNSYDFFSIDSEVSALWPYMPREMDEFALGRGDMLRILSISDDGWAIGYRLDERAHEWTETTPSEPIFPAWRDWGSMVKAFPLVCVTVPWAWKRCVGQDWKARGELDAHGARPFAPPHKKLEVRIWLKERARKGSLVSRFNGKSGEQW